MGFFDKFKKKPVKRDKQVSSRPDSAKASSGKKASADRQDKQEESEKIKEEKKVKPVKKEKTEEIHGKSQQACRVLIKPLITEKASGLGSLNKYVFAVNPRMNKVEVKKAIRSVYNVDPIMINISNFSGRKVRYGRVQGKTKSWKKAVVTLKPGDKIEVYEGV